MLLVSRGSRCLPERAARTKKWRDGDAAAGKAAVFLAFILPKLHLPG